MKFLNIIGSSVFQILSVVFFLGYLLGVLNIHFSDKNDYCIMTYMYEYPQYVRITVPENPIYPQYGLYAYSEGRFTERARKMWFEGVPVLFLPGNSGSYMQVRSLASVALRKALSSGHEYHFDFFTINYNEELSGLYGGVLESQTQFAALCIPKILSLYRSNRYTKTVPNSVILIGHSMGGLIAKRLLTFPSTINSTSFAIALAAPLKAPVVNFETTMNTYYDFIDWELYKFMRDYKDMEKKLLLSFGSGPRDILIPSGLTSSNDSYINALTTAIPGVWVSPDHVGIVWCKQLVMTINRFLFDIVDPKTNQVSVDQDLLKAKARQYFQANRSMTLNPDIIRPNVTMLADAFWYEDNRRIYQVSRPEIDKTTYLMIRLVNFPQNRFVAVEAINADDSDWVFGCNAKFAYNTYRYCKQATSLSELSHWTGSATDFGKRKLATVHLHSIAKQHPDWSHVVVKVTPTRRPIVLNVDINDHASRQLFVNLPSFLSFEKRVVKESTEPNSLYYELILPGFSYVHQAYLLYIEPTEGCKANYYHVSAELSVPWAKNNEYYHYFTHLKRSPMKLRLYESDPNAVFEREITEHVKLTLLLDPQCSFTISISTSWYHRLAQFARNYSPILVPYMAVIVLLATRYNLLHLCDYGTCVSMHECLRSAQVKPYYILVYGRLFVMFVIVFPIMSIMNEHACWRNAELHNFVRSILVVPVYMTALGLLNLAAAALLVVMVFSSQLAHRLLFRIMWRGGPGLAEKVATGLQKVPMVVSAALVCAVPLSCGAASLAAGAAFYAFMLSKMYEEYLEDYIYKLMAKAASKMCRFFKSRNNIRTNESETNLVSNSSTTEQVTSQNLKAIENKTENDKGEIVKDDKKNDENVNENDEKTEKICDESLNVNYQKNDKTTSTTNELKDDKKSKCQDNNEINGKDKTQSHDSDEQLSNLNFHMMMFYLWMVVTLINVPTLLTWARNFKYSMVLRPDSSYHAGLVMSACSMCVWQLHGPRKNLSHYEFVPGLIIVLSVIIVILGPFSLTIVNYSVTFIFAVITLQQIFEAEKPEISSNIPPNNVKRKQNRNTKENLNNEDKSRERSEDGQSKSENKVGDERNEKTQSVSNSDDCVCNEDKIYNKFKTLRDKYEHTEEE